MRSLVHDGTEQAAGTVDTILAKLWDTPGAPHSVDLQILLEFYAWIDTTDHSLGFTLLGSLDVTEYLEEFGLAGIIEEVEDFRAAKYGVIKASGFTQEFLERVTGIAITQRGSMFKQALTENDADSSVWYQWDGVDIHLWQLKVKMGSKARGVWLEPTFSWIYGWRFDPATEPVPLFDKVSRDKSTQWKVAGYSLLHWMEKMKSSELLGDYSNPSGRYPLGGVLEDKLYEEVCNFSIVPVLNEILGIAGVIKANRDIRCSPLDGGIERYSTLDYWDTHVEYLIYRDYAILDSFIWKNVGDVNYHVAVKQWYDPATIRITTFDRDTGTVEYQDIEITASTDWAITRLWYGSSGDVFYLGLDKASTNKWKIVTCTLSGTVVGSFTIAHNFSTATELSMPAGGYTKRNWQQCDLDQRDSPLRLYAAVCHNWASWATGGHSSYEMGYWNVTTGAWTTLANTQFGVNDDYTFAIPDGAQCDADLVGRQIGGFRCLRNNASARGIVAFGIRSVTGGGLFKAVLTLFAYDETTGNFYTTPFESAVYADTKVLATEWDAYPYTNDNATLHLSPRGTIGGFWDSTNNRFELVLTGHNCVVSRRMGYWFSWVPGNNPSGGTLSSVTTTSTYRTFNSTGSDNTAQGCTGFVQTGRVSASSTPDYSVSTRACFFWKDGTTRTAATGTSEEFDLGDDWEWGTLYPPSISAYSKAPSRYYQSGLDHPFCILKASGVDFGTSFFEDSRIFLTVCSEEWWPNFHKNYIEDGGSFRDELEDIAFAYNLIMRISLWDTVITTRVFPIPEADIVKTLTPELYEENQVSWARVLRFDQVSIDYGGASPALYPATGSFKNILEVSTDYVLANRASRHAERLYDEHNVNRAQYVIDGILQLQLEPLDAVKFHVPLSPGDVGYTDGENELYEFNLKTPELRVQAERIGRVMRVEVDGAKTRLTILALDTFTGLT